MRRGPRALLFVALTGITVAAAGTLEGRELRPLMRGWEQLFALEYGLGQYRGQPAVEGYVINISPYGFTRIRILIDALDVPYSWIGLRFYNLVLHDKPSRFERCTTAQYRRECSMY